MKLDWRHIWWTSVQEIYSFIYSFLMLQKVWQALITLYSIYFSNIIIIQLYTTITLGKKTI